MCIECAGYGRPSDNKPRALSADFPSTFLHTDRAMPLSILSNLMGIMS